MKPLFIPLKTEFFEAFEAGTKTTEFRPYGPRWNERTCTVGREVVLSHGYGTKRRLRGVVAAFERSAEPTTTDAWRKCYGDRIGDAACIRVELMSNVKAQPTSKKRSFLLVGWSGLLGVDLIPWTQNIRQTRPALGQRR